jgi:hypothetical protein
VTYLAALEKNVFERSILERLYNAGGVPSALLISSALQLTLRTANVSLIRNISGCIEQNWEVYNNSAMYAKLVYWALVRDCFTYIQSEPVAVPFPPGFDPVWLDLDNPNPPIADYIQAINNKSIVFVQGVDFEVVDWQLIYWLSKPDNRLDGPDEAQAHVMHNTYLNWRGINVTVMGHGPAPPPPAPIVVNSSNIITFVEKMASKRCEWDDFTKGLYIALDLIGLRYTQSHEDFYPLRTNGSVGILQLRQPADYNFMFRLLNILPTTTQSDQAETRAWIALRAVEKVRLAALYTGVLASASTTVMYDMNMHTNAIVEWCLGKMDNPLTQTIFRSVFNSPASSHPLTETVMLSVPKKAFPLWLACSVIDQLYPGAYWQSAIGTTPDAPHSLQGYAGNRPPLLFSVLCIDNWLRIRPIEWGISAPAPTVTLKSEVLLGGLPERRGWYASLGSSEYLKDLSSDCPVKYQPYGVQALNVIFQFLDLDEAPLLSRQVGMWSPGIPGQWSVPQPIPAAQFAWNPDLHILEPCTFMTF